MIEDKQPLTDMTNFERNMRFNKRESNWRKLQTALQDIGFDSAPIRQGDYVYMVPALTLDFEFALTPKGDITIIRFFSDNVDVEGVDEAVEWVKQNSNY